MGYYTDVVSSFKTKFNEGNTILDDIIASLEELLSTLSPSSGEDVDLIKGDLNSYLTKLNDIKRRANDTINMISSNAEKYDGWYKIYSDKADKESRITLGISSGNYEANYLKSARVNDNGLIEINYNHYYYDLSGMTPSNYSRPVCKCEVTPYSLIPEMKGFVGGLCNLPLNLNSPSYIVTLKDGMDGSTTTYDSVGNIQSITQQETRD